MLFLLDLRCLHLTMSDDEMTSAAQITSWVWHCQCSGQMRCCSIFGTRMRCWQSSQMWQHSSLARALLCAGFWSPLRLKFPLWRIPLLTLGKTVVFSLADASCLSVRHTADSSCAFRVCILTGDSADMQIEGQARDL